MVKKFVWTQKLSVGEAVIDSQHKKLFNQINALNKAVEEKAEKIEIKDILDFLSNYVKEHFSYEEEYMEKNNYPGLYEHKSIHESFVVFYKKLRTDILLEKISGDVLIQKVQKHLGDWLIEHIGNVDHQFAEYIQAQKKSLNKVEGK